MDQQELQIDDVQYFLIIRQTKYFKNLFAIVKQGKYQSLKLCAKLIKSDDKTIGYPEQEEKISEFILNQKENQKYGNIQKVNLSI